MDEMINEFLLFCLNRLNEQGWGGGGGGVSIMHKVFIMLHFEVSYSSNCNRITNVP